MPRAIERSIEHGRGLSQHMAGPLAGVRIVEIASIGPGPYCGMMLADMGADVLTIDRDRINTANEPLHRNRHRVAIDLKSAAGIDALLRIIDRAEAVFEGNRPGVAERLGFGPDVCLARNPALVYGRMTGWGQSGPLAQRAGHDINYIALSGALQAIGRKSGKPTPPLNLLGDFGGGGMLLAFGMVCALLEAKRSGQGQVVDAAMLDGSIALMAMFIGDQQRSESCETPGSHCLSGAAHYYDTYETSDGRFVAIGPLEPQFYTAFLAALGLDSIEFADSGCFDAHGQDSATWERLKPQLAAVFRTRTREQWCDLLEGLDVCVTPVLSLSEAPQHPHVIARESFVEVDGCRHNAPAPRFSRSTTRAAVSLHTRDAIAALLHRWQCSASDTAQLLAAAGLAD